MCGRKVRWRDRVNEKETGDILIQVSRKRRRKGKRRRRRPRKRRRTKRRRMRRGGGDGREGEERGRRLRS